MRPNRDYPKHLTWTYEMNENLYDIYNEAKQEGRGYVLDQIGTLSQVGTSSYLAYAM